MHGDVIEATPEKPQRSPLDEQLTPASAAAALAGVAGGGHHGIHPRDLGWRSPLEPQSPGSVAGSQACIADFELLEKLGKGNCGVVHKARRLADQKLYVIKQIDLEALHPDDLQQAVVEAQVLAALDNRYIIQYCDSFVDEQQLNIVMEWAAAGNLNDVIERGRKEGKTLSENAVWRYLIQLLLGLQHIHSKKIVHRDIKSLNIFLADEDFIKIGDLGVARFMSTNTTMAETVVGTPFYMSPELFEEKPYSAKTDVWALGCVLFEVCTYGRPFEASNQAALMLKILRGKYDEQAISNKGYSPELADVVNACLTMDPAFRPAVEELLSRESVIAKAAELQIPIPPGAIPTSIEKRIAEKLPRPAQFVKHFVKDRVAKPNAARLLKQRTMLREKEELQQWREMEDQKDQAAASKNKTSRETYRDPQWESSAMGRSSRFSSAAADPHLHQPHQHSRLGGGGVADRGSNGGGGLLGRNKMAESLDPNLFSDATPRRAAALRRAAEEPVQPIPIHFSTAELRGDPTAASGGGGSGAQGGGGVGARGALRGSEAAASRAEPQRYGGGGGAGRGGRGGDALDTWRSQSQAISILPREGSVSPTRSGERNSPTPTMDSHVGSADSHIGGSHMPNSMRHRQRSLSDNHHRSHGHTQRQQQRQAGHSTAHSLSMQARHTGSLSMMHRSSPVPSGSYQDSHGPSALGAGSSSHSSSHQSYGRPPAMARLSELNIPAHHGTPKKQQRPAAVMESPLGNFMAQQFGIEHRMAGHNAAHSRENYSHQGLHHRPLGGYVSSSYPPSSGSRHHHMAVGPMSPLSQLVNANFGDRDLEGQHFWEELQRSVREDEFGSF